MKELNDLTDALAGKIVTAQATSPSLGGDTYRGLVVGALNIQTLWVRCPYRIEVLCLRSTAIIIPPGERTPDELLMVAEFETIEKLARDLLQKKSEAKKT